MIHNLDSQTFAGEVRTRIFPTISATAIRLGETPWKQFQALPGQTVVESAPLDFPPEKAETKLLVQWVDNTSHVIGETAVWVCRGALAGMDGYSIEDKIERGSGMPRAFVTYRGDAGRRLLHIAWPDPYGSEHFLAALSQYLTAAISKDHVGLMQIGEKYVTGEDAPKSATKAWLWFSLAAANGVPGAEPKIFVAEKSMAETDLKEVKQLLPGWVKDFNSVTAMLRGAEDLKSTESPGQIHDK